MLTYDTWRDVGNVQLSFGVAITQTQADTRYVLPIIYPHAWAVMMKWNNVKPNQGYPNRLLAADVTVTSIPHVLSDSISKKLAQHSNMDTDYEFPELSRSSSPSIIANTWYHPSKLKTSPWGKIYSTSQSTDLYTSSTTEIKFASAFLIILTTLHAVLCGRFREN